MNLTARQRDVLGHIAENCRKAAELCGQVREPSAADWQARYALIYCIQVIGEAAGRLGPEFRSEFPVIPWRDITGMRNRLVHGYDDVSDELL